MYFFYFFAWENHQNSNGFFSPAPSPTHEKLRSAIADSKITFSNIETEKFERESPQMASELFWIR